MLRPRGSEPPARLEHMVIKRLGPEGSVLILGTIRSHRWFLSRWEAHPEGSVVCGVAQRKDRGLQKCLHLALRGAAAHRIGNGKWISDVRPTLIGCDCLACCVGKGSEPVAACRGECV